ncbi:MAG: hypothetical protein JWR44_2655 [Hymenobacter sp.]|jgi:hypothetical protein|nr:hypothetical protein [Hymenobacter sp.]
MNSLFPFYVPSPESERPGIYHTHPRCRIAQSIALENRVAGTGEGLKECPFCYLLGQFQVNKALRGHAPPGSSEERDRSASPSANPQDAMLS